MDKIFEENLKQEALQEIKKKVIEVEKLLFKFTFKDTKEFYELFRLLHNIKGEAQLAQLNELAAISHVYENLLQSLTDGKIQFTEEIKRMLENYSRETQSFCQRMLQETSLEDSDNTFNEVALHLEEFIQTLSAENKEVTNSFEIKTGPFSFLLVDDDPDLREILKFHLQELYPKSTIQEVENGERAIPIINTKKFHAIITDFQMPCMNGNELISFLRLGNSLNNKSPIILLSGYKPELDQRWCHEDSLFFLEKPITSKKLKYYLNCCLYRF